MQFGVLEIFLQKNILCGIIRYSSLFDMILKLYQFQIVYLKLRIIRYDRYIIFLDKFLTKHVDCDEYE